ncbi:MAG: hypothetical protein EPN33_13515 [Acidobacteria bacterium]|nr:MAG: hypothetical protein EPN33_13515 [Acidobacteriota bacterium]
MQNGFIESCNGRMRDECLNLHEFATVPHLRASSPPGHSGLDGTPNRLNVSPELDQKRGAPHTCAAPVIANTGLMSKRGTVRPLAWSSRRHRPLTAWRRRCGRSR